jgi:hypothetical protein
MAEVIVASAVASVGDVSVGSTLIAVAGAMLVMY